MLSLRGPSDQADLRDRTPAFERLAEVMGRATSLNRENDLSATLQICCGAQRCGRVTLGLMRRCEFHYGTALGSDGVAAAAVAQQHHPAIIGFLSARTAEDSRANVCSMSNSRSHHHGVW
jgi:hypothetical protein